MKYIINFFIWAVFLMTLFTVLAYVAGHNRIFG